MLINIWNDVNPALAICKLFIIKGYMIINIKEVISRQISDYFSDYFFVTDFFYYYFIYEFFNNIQLKY
jgi:hypothetical protein